MEVIRFCEEYFSGFHEVIHFNENDNQTNALAALKIVSYFTIIIPISFAAAYCLASLVGRITAKEKPTVQDKKVSEKAKEILAVEAPPPVTPPVPIVSKDIQLSEVLSAYDPGFVPEANAENLKKYWQSPDFQRHAQTACIYYNSAQLAPEDALRVVFQREPTNIAMLGDQYDQARLKELFGYEKGIYNSEGTKKADQTSFRDLPNTAAVYSETCLWDTPGGKTKKEVACLSLPAPALDSPLQPNYSYYVQEGVLNEEKYRKEMAFLFKCIERALRDHKQCAFQKKGIKRVMLTRFGQGAFLGALSEGNRKIANQVYKEQLAVFLANVKETGIVVLMSEYNFPKSEDDIWLSKMMLGDILKTSRQGDLIVNAWDPHSAPGNGNDADNSFDGVMGRGSGILATQTSWLNKNLRNPNCLIPVMV